MSRKIIVLNIALLLLIIIIFRVGDYFMNYYYPTDFYSDNVSNEDWQLLFLLIFICFLLSGVLSLIPIRLFTFKNRWGGLFGVFNFFILVNLFDYFFENKKRFEDLEKEVVVKAQRDIKNDEVVWFFEQGFVILDDEKLERRKDSIYAKYGIKVEDMGCIITPHQDALEQKYKAVVKDYLDKRNGEGWEMRLEKELERIK